MSEPEKEGFLSRWSRRKRAPADAEADTPPAGEAVEAVAVPAPAEAASQPDAIRPACPIPDVPAIDPATLPPIESLTAESDFSLFLRPGVPSLLRSAALRRMWSLDPAIRDYIGPVEYQWDFNAPGGLPFGFSNELGGDVAKLLAQAIGRIEDLAPDALPDGAPDAQPEAADKADTPAPDPGPAVDGDAAAPIAEAPAAAPAEPDPGPAPRRRHGGALPA